MIKDYITSTVLVAIFGILVAYTAVNASRLALAPNQLASLIVVESESPVNPPVVEKEIPTLPAVVKLNFVGDIMLDRGTNFAVNKNGEGDFTWLFNDVSVLAASDILFGNLEGPLSDQGRKQGSIYSFRMNPEAVSALAGAGFDVLSSANNHIGDWGREAAEDTVSRLAAVGITSVGFGPNLADTATPKIIERNGIRIGFLAFSDVGPDWLVANDQQSGIILARNPRLPEIIKQASAQVDHLVVSFHFGEEYKTAANERQKSLAHLAIDNGARLVIGHHPHVAEEVERYGNGLIAYSLGNFIFDQAFSAETMRGLLLQVVLDKNSIKSAKTRQSSQDPSFQPHLSLESLDV